MLSAGIHHQSTIQGVTLLSIGTTYGAASTVAAGAVTGAGARGAVAVGSCVSVA